MDQDSLYDILSSIEQLERLSLEFERELRGGGDGRSLVHVLFRNAHNLKSSLAVQGCAPQVGVIHACEGRLDSIRSGKSRATLTTAEALLAAVDSIRSSLTGAGPDAEPLAALQRAIEDSGKTFAAPPSADSGGALRIGEADRLSDAAARGHSVYRVEKLIDAGLPPDAVARLPIFETLSKAGAVISSSVNRPAAGNDAVLSILFETQRTEEELSYLVFDPLIPISLQDSARAGTSAEAPPSGLPAAQAPEAARDAAREESSRAAPPSGDLPRFLAVDDESIALLMEQRALSAYGRVDTAGSGEEALELFARARTASPYAAVFLDLRMPGMQGEEVLSAIRGQEAESGAADGEGVPVVIVSSKKDYDTVSALFKAQCDMYIVKPIDPPKLRAAMGKLGFRPVPGA